MVFNAVFVKSLLVPLIMFPYGTDKILLEVRPRGDC